MENLNLYGNGMVSLPPGFRFHPTDEELVLHYLKHKVFNKTLPASVILDIDNIFKSDPWDLPGGGSDEDRYFFSTREVKNGNGTRWNRATRSGYWKATGLDKQIAISKEQHLVGMKKTLVFYKGKPSNGCRTDWIMHEYRLAATAASAPQPQGNWVLCRIFLKKRGTKNGSRGASLRPTFRDFFARERADLNLTPASSSSSSSRSSVVTDSCNYHQETSSCTSFRREH